jgi:lactoylglutathione lyase
MTPETQTEPNVEQAVPFFGVRDIEESVRFYVDGLGFKMKRKWVDEGKLRWCWLELGGAAVMLQEFGKEGHHRNIPDEQLGIGVSINFICKDALAIYHESVSRGLPAKRPFVGNSMWVTELSDPDGYRLYFESPTDVPEETVYAEAS